MADKFISLKKQSKKKKREYYAKQRTTWTISPVSKIVPNKKAYNRKSTRWRREYE